MDTMIYILAALISLCLVGGQSLWGSAVKQLASAGAKGMNLDLLLRMPAHPKFWLGAACYVIGTVLYFLLLSQAKFFSVQITMTGVAVILSVAVSFFVFKEQVSIINIVGIALVVLGIIFVTQR